MQPLLTAIAGIAFLYAGGTYFDRGSERRSMHRRAVSLIVAGLAIILAAAAGTVVPH